MDHSLHARQNKIQMILILIQLLKALRREKTESITSLDNDYILQLSVKNANVFTYIRVYRLIKGNEIKS